MPAQPLWTEPVPSGSSLGVAMRICPWVVGMDRSWTTANELRQPRRVGAADSRFPRPRVSPWVGFEGSAN